ncbi:FxsA family protein [Brachybacterium halotolerans subsp. kimchii]|uniref:FxsA family protein n=1 Tax=Brachybacterium halotolerans TaxID=2795215 RepID=UPI001E4A5291|nr:FxsA family protein [Brachybacterium halotolerans]UEJ83183.1 FxsA family protein [Brachybacterium halotolerans subsp. kimchii]
MSSTFSSPSSSSSSGRSSSGASSAGSSTGASQGRPPSGRRSRLAPLLPYAALALGIVEIALLILIGVRSSLWWSLLIIVVGWIVGVALLIAAGQQSFSRARSLWRALRGTGDVQKHLSRPAFTMLAAACFFFPGILTDIVGIILLLTPVQRRTVEGLGLSGGGDAAHRVLFRRSSGGVIDGEIVVTPQKPSGGSSSGQSPDGPPLITQD